MMRAHQKFAMIYPIFVEYAKRVFEGKDVFCKYVGKRQIYVDTGTIIIFYGSRFNKELLGQADVATVEYLNPQDIISKYSDRIFITQKELEDYRGNRPTNYPLAVFLLTNVKRYSKPVVLKKRITIAGQSLTEDQYLSLVVGAIDRH